ncbi:MAG: metallophosphoesterase family protein, partial [Anaerolineae bacterium]|nr:metallophosphoesterase family protein [Anaerolineae bacterium]
WGNNDGDKLHISASVEGHGNVHIHGEFAELALDGRRIALTHYPHLARALAVGQQYDLVCYGHNHERAIRWEGRTLLVNPGEVMGRFGVSSWAVYDTESGRAEIVERLD